MAYKISDACVKCGSCAPECPVDAISEGENQYEIDADACYRRYTGAVNKVSIKDQIGGPRGACRFFLCRKAFP